MPRCARRYLLPCLALTLVALSLPSAAFGQATRTWVSGVGDDANPCSRTAPCKTLAGAMGKTAAGGQISGIDGGGFGAVSINKSLTIDLSRVWEAGVLSNVSNGVTVNAGAADKVVLKGLNINGLNSSFHGVRILRAKSVKIIDTHIWNWGRNGVSFEPVDPGSKLTVKNSSIHDNGGAGVMTAPPSTGVGKVTLRANDIDDNGCGVVATTFGPDPAFNYASNCGTAPSTSGVSGRATINMFRNEITDNTGAGVLSRGNKGTVRLSKNEITSNAFGIQAVDGGTLLSWGDNVLNGNSTDGTPTAALLPFT